MAVTDVNKLGEALYVVNKYAKKIRDERKRLKEYLFERPWGEFWYYKPADFVFDLDFDIKDRWDACQINVPFWHGDPDWFSSIDGMEEYYYHGNDLIDPYSYWAGEIETHRDIYEPFIESYAGLKGVDKGYVEDEMPYMISNIIGHDYTKKLEEGWPFGYEAVRAIKEELELSQEDFLKLQSKNPEFIMLLLSWQLENIRLKKYIVNVKKRLDFLHELLSELRDIKDYYYDLKERVIKALNLEPFAIHRFEGDEKHVYPMYVIGNYTFHTLEYRTGEVEFEDLKELPEISSSNVESDLTINQAIRILENFLFQQDSSWAETWEKRFCGCSSFHRPMLMAIYNNTF